MDRRKKPPLVPDEPSELTDSLELHICPQCSGELVYPTAWEERSDDMWRIQRRCPDCEWTHTGDHAQDEVEIFDDMLNDGTEELLIAARNLARERMEEDVERLIVAIQSGGIEPMDF